VTIDSEINKAVIKLSTGGRGFIIEAGNQRLVVTAGHCLPELPPPNPLAYAHERTYPKLLGQLGDGEPQIWAECVFVDPIADIAVLGSPDNQELWEQADAYEELVENSSFLRISDSRLTSNAWLLGLNGIWSPCKIKGKHGIFIEHAADGIHGGMSGSPIIADDGTAIGIVSVSSGALIDEVHTSGGPNPSLTNHLPGWLLREIATPCPATVM
jgi:trypsin-like peptidase